jgi:hypothetical protein
VAETKRQKKENQMKTLHCRWLGTPALGALLLLLGACVQKPILPPDQPQPQPEVVQPQMPRIDPLADVPGDKPLPVAQGALERIDCTKGTEDLHARMAFEARGGRIENFAYYSKWKPRTCALDFARNTPGTKWRLTSDGATRVHTPQGRFLIRTQADAYVFQFEQVQRSRFCGMSGEINGTMIIRRGVAPPQCSVAGVMDANDTYLDALYGGRMR